ncbi:VOC family protein [Chloroflexi bacterium TSY]|nr:VOC family protein [Chloroflexi bacterium TSY]
MNSKVSTCLWFNGNGVEAAQFYTSLIPNSSIKTDLTTNEAPLIVEFTLDDVPYQALNGGPNFQFNEAASIVVETEDQAETDKLWQALTADGGQESMCGWLKDKFGLSWQIVPRPVIKLLNSDDKASAERAMNAVLTMKRLVIADIEKAAFSNDD